MSCSSVSSSQSAYPSPLDRLKTELASQVKAGTVKANDQDALTGALDDIDAAIKNQRADGTSRASPGQAKSKIEDLISSEVDNGKLTSDEAEELKNVFAKVFAGQHGHHAHGGGGPPPADSTGTTDGTDPLLAALNSADSSQSSSAQPSSASSVSDEALKLLNDFVQSLQQSLSKAGYGANGQSASISAAFVVNYQS